MDDLRLVDGLLKRQESDDLDFKSYPYNLRKHLGKSRFIKDIVAMVNTPRSGSAYILVGVREQSGKAVGTPGVEDHPDEAELGRIVSGKVTPIPRFSYRQVSYRGVELGLIEIPLGQPVPVMARANYEALRSGTVYLRRNTQNTEADHEDILRIARWSQGEASQTQSSPEHSTPSGSWEQFYRACDGFDPRRVYIAVLDRESSVDTHDWTAMASIHWKRNR